MTVEFRLPALGADMDAGTIVEWHVQPGSRVKRGDVVAVVETDKGAIDVEIFEDGVVREILVQPGTRVPVGTALARIEADGGPAGPTAAAPGQDVETPPAVPAREAASEPRAVAAERAVATPAREAGSRRKISPAARKRARELDVDVESLQGTGPDGAITLDDVERARPSAEQVESVRPAETAETAEAVAVPAVTAGEPGGGMRTAIAAAMSRSKREIPHYYLSTTADVTDVVEWLRAHNASVPVDERLLLAALLVKAIALACRDRKGFSGYFRDGRYEESPAAHVGVAVALRGGGLVAPAIMDTADKPLAALMQDFRALVMRARAGRLRASELAAPTIILTSLGDAAVETVFPIIQPPQVAIVGAGAVVERAGVVQGQVEPRQVVTVSLGADHRVTDGRLGGQFLADVVARLGKPDSL
jgi:pyruvate dehydrogenase E2 component (dihydrolipoamide acetyltransferase)